MTAQILLAIAGLALLTFAADHLVLGSSRIATRLRISPVVVGVVVIGVGTSAPEFLVSGVAAAEGHTGIALGNISGSNILNLTLILGVAALIGRLAVASAVIRREVPLAVAAVVLFGVLAFTGLNVWAGILLAMAMVAAIWLLLCWANQGRNTELANEVAEYTHDDSPETVGEPVAALPANARLAMPAWFEPIRAVLGLAGVLAGAQLLVANASAIAQNLGVPQLIIGFTLVALGTSLPELVTTIQAMRRSESDLVVGNLFGSNLFNSLAGGAVVAFAAPAGNNGTIAVGIAVTMILTGGLAWALLRRGLTLTRVEGGVLLAAYVLTMPLLLAS
jgi:cation:H+ antiporter